MRKKKEKRGNQENRKTETGGIEKREKEKQRKLRKDKKRDRGNWEKRKTGIETSKKSVRQKQRGQGKEKIDTKEGRGI
jgi:hypothetical protein